MRVLLLTDSDAFAGTERHLLDLAAVLGRQGVGATLGCPADSPLATRAVDDGLDWAEVPRGLRAGVRAIRQRLAHGSIDVLHAHNGRSLLMAALATPRRPRPPLVTTLHFIQLTRESRRGLRGFASRRLHGWLTGRLAATIAISDAVADAARQRGDDPARLVRIHNGTSEPRLDLSPETVRQALSLDPGTRLIVTAARLEREKDAGLIVEAAVRLKQRRGTDFVWAIAGDGSLRGALAEADREAFGDDSPLRWLGHRDDVHGLMAAADVVVHTAPAEPFGLVLIEAMALGKPVFAPNGGAAAEVILDGETGALYPPGGAAALADQVHALLAHPERLAAWGEAGRARHAAHFTAERMAERVAALYRDLLSRSAVSALKTTHTPAADPCASS